MVWCENFVVEIGRWCCDDGFNICSPFAKCNHPDIDHRMANNLGEWNPKNNFVYQNLECHDVQRIAICTLFYRNLCFLTPMPCRHRSDSPECEENCFGRANRRGGFIGWCCHRIWFALSSQVLLLTICVLKPACWCHHVFTVGHFVWLFRNPCLITAFFQLFLIGL